MSFLVIGSARLIGTGFVLNWLLANREPIMSVDKRCAGSLGCLPGLESYSQHASAKGDIGGPQWVTGLLEKYQPRAAIANSTKSNMNCSIYGKKDFIQKTALAFFAC